MKYLVTGSAGFIGSHLCISLLKNKKNKVIGLDNHNSYYEPSIKENRLKQFKTNKNYTHHRVDISNRKNLNKIFKRYKPEYVINLAAQAGVRYSIENPLSYIQSNIFGFTNILEACRHYKVKHLIYASTSSVYGANNDLPFTENQNTNHPLSLYAASKKANEVMAHSYSHLYNLPTTGLRFFTVYGPWGRPDMALFKFTKAMIKDEEIEVYNFGKHTRDFTYISDIINGLKKTLTRPPKKNINWNGINPNPASSKAPWRIYNIGNSKPVKLLDYVSALEKVLGKKAKIKYLPMQPGDVKDTYASTKLLFKIHDYKPKTSVTKGVANFVKWYLEYYNLKK